MNGFGRTGNRTNGFTLIELMIGIAIIAILSALAVPAVVDWLPNYRLRKAANAVYSAMQSLRLEAVRANSERGIFFNTAANTYQILNDPGPDGNWGTADDTNDQPGPDGIYGNADDIPERPSVRLASFGDGITFGWGNATINAEDGGGALPGDPVAFGALAASNTAVFSARGMLNPPSGSVYIQDARNVSFAVGVLTSGAVRIRKWFDASANWG